MDYDVIIIGAGMSGLTAANYLHGHDLKVKVFESESEVGGRVRSFEKNGYILDRGFQVFLPSYPEASRLLNYEDLDLKYFMNGAYILGQKKPYYLIDPIEKPSYLFNALFETSISLKDKLKLFQLKQSLKSKSLNDILKGNKTNTRQEISKRKYSIDIVKDFFQPFLSGIFLEKDLSTNSSMFEFVIKMFNEKGAAIPAKGIGQIPKQLKHNLPPGMVECSKRVMNIENNTVLLEDGSQYSAKNIVLAVEGNSKLTDAYLKKRNSDYVSVKNFYFSADKATIEEGLLILNSDDQSIINNLCFISKIASDYAPKDKELLSVTILNTKKFSAEEVLKEIRMCLPGDDYNWEYVDSFDIAYALPKQEKVKNTIPINELRPEKGIYIAGDFSLYGSLNAAMQSGRAVADQILTDMGLIKD